jgi:hypothetical protein
MRFSRRSTTAVRAATIKAAETITVEMLPCMVAMVAAETIMVAMLPCMVAMVAATEGKVAMAVVTAGTTASPGSWIVAQPTASHAVSIA